MSILTVEDMIKDESLGIKFEVMAGYEGLQKEIVATDINRPGLALAGYLTFFGSRRIQILGKGEISYLDSLDSWTRLEILKKICEFEIPCFISTWGMGLPTDLLDLSNEYQIPVLRTQLPTGATTTLLSLYLEKMFAQEESISGGLVDIYGVGVLIMGEAGVGKSECAMDLIERGHRLIADDVVKIKRLGGGLIGSSPDMIRYHMEVRGLGVINVREMFGISAVCHHKEIELIVRLETWGKTQKIERLGIENLTENMLDISLPMVIIPVKPGRNISVIVEVAAMNQRLKKLGHHSALELDQRVAEEIRRQAIAK
ncbi:HPr(Ser) kinase/phosphatase [Candidatus Desantisbacteria bacterium CG2_30_40_21]|uniref:HPr kinase/phosphorylase n=5 Tax=unclassified Candidatus Desantisiibacteriota TaxID=3106372 RepID=A0A2M7JDH4_9BACT|nr:MAG: HPr(Ser) kinase/phosphatase [Candidatus Desantisbacteria bacterium CG2_30_40_21]PIP40235.1 MAG: HPr(Ser) kinase/phosphatase [Candidatus Desantisbacteria bacterium CG23_combo_of_CG06-09_8_20_14_all_40_23]PIX17451.1 MAG: HPr(Ser) kinase/phosphatase [Candidatus Desantisbacteria bacterium CG_4_8_14_3_um_filter_40_12]PIY18847.1 MAG: HPr(Ser) kinase/phosphatase [Candidatus Desantisbacteria bacterium CG_4_10_14_3_um_filter_40_18]PJB29968.1 MAG: HPr(Ser) kinase/phosphatase [Candidatus Desantisb